MNAEIESSAGHRQVSKNKCGGCMHGDKAVAGAEREEREKEREIHVAS